MTISVSRLAEGFASRLDGVDTTRPKRRMQRTTVSGTPDVTPAR